MFRKIIFSCCATTLTMLIPTVVYATLAVHKIYTDYMVLQREKPIHISGTATPGTTVTVTLAKQFSFGQNRYPVPLSYDMPGAHFQAMPIYITGTVFLPVHSEPTNRIIY